MSVFGIDGKKTIKPILIEISAKDRVCLRDKSKAKFDLKCFGNRCSNFDNFFEIKLYLQIFQVKKISYKVF